MSPRIVIPIFGIGVLGLALALNGAKPVTPAALTQASAPTSLREAPSASLVSPGRDARRSFELLASAPDLDAARIQTLRNESDRMRAVAEEQGEQDLGAELRRRMAEIEVAEQEAQAFFSQERSLFGDRSFEESRAAIRQMLVIRKTRAEYGIPR